jgi:radical SAM superfamily enzyme YgiQ (UPF0313 family)
MRVLLVSANDASNLQPVFPLGIAYVAANLGSGHESRALDLYLTQDWPPELEQLIASYRPALIGVSIRNLDTQNYFAPSSLLEVPRELVRTCHKLTDAPVVIGGTATSLMPVRMLQYLEADAAIAGEGETHFREAVNARAAGRPLDGAPGTVASDAEAVELRPEDVNNLRPPDWGLFSLSEYVARGVAANVQTKRGCPFRCVYCATHLLEARAVRLRDPEAVADEIEELAAAHGVRTVHFVDDNFNHPLAHALALCETFTRRGLPVRWICNLHPGFVDEELVAAMKRAGCIYAAVGSESANEQMLANLRRAYSPADVERTCRLLSQAGVENWASLLLGGPGETPATVEESIARMGALEGTSVGITVGIRVHPGTELAEIARREGLIDGATDLLFPAFYLSPAVANTIVEQVRGALAEHRNWSSNAVPGTISWRPPQSHA